MFCPARHAKPDPSRRALHAARDGRIAPASAPIPGAADAVSAAEAAEAAADAARWVAEAAAGPWAVDARWAIALHVLPEIDPLAHAQMATEAKPRGVTRYVDA